ncbi:MAG: PQQ-binding-like beta-propeller repeat protein, partial [Verrucomicrobiota bacterium]
YGLGPKGTLVCLTLDGEKVWSKSYPSDFSGKAGGWGYSDSPLVDDGKVIAAPGGSKAGLVALDAKTGDVIWEADSVQPGKAEYASVLAVTIHGKKQYVKFFEKEIVSVDTENGDLLWSASFPEGKTAVIPTPIIDGDQLYVAAGYGAGCRAYRIGEDFSVTELWANKEMVNHHGGVIKYGDYLYGMSDGKGLVCQDWRTGAMVWNERERQHMAKGAVHLADGHLYVLNEQNGALTLVEATNSGFKEKGRFVLELQSSQRNPKGKVWTHPVVIGGKLFLRDQELIQCFDVKG